jgi:hypothetical protein
MQREKEKQIHTARDDSITAVYAGESHCAGDLVSVRHAMPILTRTVA